MIATKSNTGVQRSFCYTIFFRKNNSLMKTETFNELKVAHELECDPNVRAFACQPAQISNKFKDKTLNLTVEF